jgi:hypothetical protein
MPAYLDPILWHDVYKTGESDSTGLYIKLQISHDGEGVIISFKQK